MARIPAARPLGLVIALVLLLVGASCDRGAPPQAEPGPSPELARERLVALLTGPEELFGATPEEAVERLGPPASRNVEERPNPDDPAQQDRRHHLHWPGLELVFVETPGADRAWLDRARATASRADWPPGDLLGEDEERVAAWLGPPSRQAEGGAWLYADEMAAAYVHALLRFDGGRLVEVVWEAEAD